jgi:uncharacterized protein (TIGR04255 family)
LDALPRRLRKEPIVEAIWQARFDNAMGLGDIVPGMLFSALQKSHPGLQPRRLPLADIPEAIAKLDPNLRFTPKLLLEEPGGSFLWQVGDRVITLNCRKPYVGWARFKDAIVELTRIIEGSGQVDPPQRHSLRYIDMLAGELADDLSVLKVAMQVGALAVRNRVQLRVEIPEVDCQHVVQVATEAELRLAGEELTGTVVDLETYATEPAETWSAVREQLDNLHDRSKGLYFRQILTEASIQKLDPEY